MCTAAFEVAEGEIHHFDTIDVGMFDSSLLRFRI